MLLSRVGLVENSDSAWRIRCRWSFCNSLPNSLRCTDIDIELNQIKPLLKTYLLDILTCLRVAVIGYSCFKCSLNRAVYKFTYVPHRIGHQRAVLRKRIN